MLTVLGWWATVSLMGWTVFPLGLRFFNRLPGRGYALSKALGLLLVSYLFWLLASFKLLSNNFGGIVIAWAAVLAVSLAVYARRSDKTASLRAFVRERWRYILATEIIFLVALVGWAIFRSYDPDLVGTEKPMEFAFLTAILRSPSFPPHDPWLSGYAISYYYFGYVMIAALTKLTSTVPAVAFNVGIALLFALTLTGAFGVVYELIRWRRESQSEGGAIGFALLGPLFVGIAGNLEGLLEVLHAKGIGSAGFWSWVNINGLASAPVSGTWMPQGHWWWWRASRVIFDTTVTGQYTDVIDEFPNFSFALADMHPHVLALPFVLLAIAVAVQVIRWAAEQPMLALPTRKDAGTWFTAWLTRDAGRNVLIALALGALGFLNTWDFPIYWGLVVMCYAAGRYLVAKEFSRAFVLDVVFWSGRVLLLGVLLFLPFYVGFSSQASGLGVVLLNQTAPVQYFVMFGLFVVASVAYAVHLLSSWLSKGEQRWTADITAVAAVLLPVIVLSIFFGKWTALGVALLAGLLALGTTRRLARLAQDNADGDGALNDVVVGIMMVVAFALTVVVEFVFLRDYFNTRMNTVFKFYYQAWVLLALGGAYTVWLVLGRRAQTRTSSARSVAQASFGIVFGVLLVASLLYPAAAITSKANGFSGRSTLNCLAFVQDYKASEYEAVEWLNANAEGAPVVLEATGGSYSEYGRISARTGLPTVLGWDFHEQQWRGDKNPAGSRAQDVEAIYRAPTDPNSLTLLDRYDIRYIYIGDLERSKYGLTDALINRWDQIAERVYDQDGVRIYRYTPGQPPSGAWISSG